VDQITTLDPRPVGGLLISDEAAKIYENTLYADNYYEKKAKVHGDVVGGAYNRCLDGYLNGVGGYGDGLFDDHSDVHLWYYGTVDTGHNAWNNEQIVTDYMRATWYYGLIDPNGYEANDALAGYHYSRINGHLWDGPTEGYFNRKTFTQGNQTPSNRATLNRGQNTQWPNVIQLVRTDTKALNVGGPINLAYIFQSYSNNAAVSFYLSTTQNPYDSSAIEVPTNDAASHAPTVLGTPKIPVIGTIPSTVNGGTSYYLYAKIKATNQLTRYTYFPGQVYIAPAADPTLQPPTNLNASPISSTAIALAWTGPSGNETGLRVERSSNGGASWATIAANLPKGTTTFTDPALSDPPLSSSTPYAYRVAAFSAASPKGAYSNTAQATTFGASVVTHTLGVQSVNPNSGISTLVAPVDRNGASDGYTPFTRTYNNSTSVFFSVPATTTGGKLFQKWQRNGVYYSNSPSLTVLVDADYVFSAVYADPPVGGDPGGVVVAPVISPPGGTFTDAVTVSLTCATSDALLRYTTDGTQPTIYSTAYTGPFSVTQATTVTATAFKPNTSFSATGTASFTISYSQALPTPSIGPNGGTFANPLNVGIVCGVQNAEVYYTFDGSTPQRSSNTILSPVTVFVNQTTTIKARAFKDGMNPSAVATATFTITNPQNNDNFANRIRLFSPESSTSGSNVSATSETGEPRIYMNDKPDPTYWPPNHSVWWVWRAPYTGSVTFDTSGAPGSWNGPSNFDTRLGVFTGSVLSSLTRIGGDDDSGYGNFCSKFTFNAIAGTDYNIVVDGWGSVTGRVELYWKMTTPPPPLPPYTPISLGPPDGGTGIRHRAFLYSLQFKDFNAGDTHAASEWIIKRNSDSAVVFDSGEDPNNKVSIQLPFPLASNTSYSFIVRHKDSSGLWSDYSSPTSFTTRGPDPISVNITAPTQDSIITGSSVAAAGTATATFTITEVRWTTDFGDTGIATPGTAWTIPQIPIHPNQNSITISVKDDDGNTGTASVQFNGVVPDTINPTLAILFPTTGPDFDLNTTQTYLSGSASDQGGVASITWTNDRGGNGTATGTGNWSAGPITFVAGDNVITVRATDFAGNFKEKALRFHVAPVPVATTLAASTVVFNGATLNGTVNPNGLAATAHFEYGLTNAYGTATTDQSAGAGTTAVPVQAILSGLTPNTIYHYQVFATNSSGPGNGGDLTFTTPKSTNADLASLVPSAGTLSPSFASGTLAYAASVSNATASITVTPTVAQAGATVKVNGTTMASGSASAAIALAVGVNPAINIAVTAQDGVTVKTYTFTVTRANPPSNNADLASLVPSAGTLSPSFASGTLAYAASVSNATASITVTPTVAQANATVKVNGTTVASGSASAAIALAVGVNPAINIAVTAQDGVTVKTYTLTVTRAGALSNNADLASLVPSAGTLAPSFASGTLNYTTTVAKSALYYTLTPTVAQAGATVTVNGTAVTSGSASGHIPLSVGSNNVITIAVIAPAGGSPQIYTITVTRASVVPSRDWSGDAKPDLVFQNNAGQLYQWALDGTGRVISFSPKVGINSFGYLYGGGLSDWRVVGVADVNGDGIPDLVFQNGAGQIYAWFLDGTGNALNFSTGAGLKGSRFLYTGGLGDWRVTGVADVNGDGNPDLLFQNGAGQLYAWFLNGTGAEVNFGTRVGLAGDRFLYTAGLGDWRVAGIMDVNGDNLPDLVFQNNAGQLYAWFLNGSGAAINFGTGAGLTGSVFLYTGGLGDWRVR